jgi:hypothetical protein
MFEYDDQGRAVDYICTHYDDCRETCEAVRVHMVNWNNNLPTQIRGRVAKRDIMLGSEVSVSSITG